MIADSRRLLCSFTVTVSATQTYIDHTTPYTVTGQTGEFSSFVKKKKENTDLVNKLQFVERRGKPAAVTWCLCVAFYRLTLPGCVGWVCVCVLVPDHILNLLHTTAIKETTAAASLKHSPIIQLTVCIILTY